MGGKYKNLKLYETSKQEKIRGNCIKQRICSAISLFRRALIKFATNGFKLRFSSEWFAVSKICRRARS
jgi:hypothetical protein